MTEHKFTPGPYTIVGPSDGALTGFDDGGDYGIVDSAGKVIAETIEKVGRKPDGTYDTRPALANAQLFRASPDLLDICEKIAAALNCNYTAAAIDYEYGNDLRNLIREAREG